MSLLPLTTPLHWDHLKHCVIQHTQSIAQQLHLWTLLVLHGKHHMILAILSYLHFHKILGFMYCFQRRFTTILFQKFLFNKSQYIFLFSDLKTFEKLETMSTFCIPTEFAHHHLTEVNKPEADAATRRCVRSTQPYSPHGTWCVTAMSATLPLLQRTISVKWSAEQGGLNPVSKQTRRAEL